MSLPANVVSIHPYFKVHPGQFEAAQALLPAFRAKTAGEASVLYYEFTINGDVVFCREGYVGGAGALAHLQNVGELLGEMLKISDLIRLEIHGPASEIAILREPLAAHGAVFFELAE